MPVVTYYTNNMPFVNISGDKVSAIYLKAPQEKDG